MLPISIILPCRKRGALVEKTLQSIKSQASLDNPKVIIVEDGCDGITESVATKYGATYLRYTRASEYPEFQSVSGVMNTGLRAVTTDLVVMQAAEVFYENQTALWDMSIQLGKDRNKMVCALVRETNPDGRFVNWMNHPTEGTRPRWIFGGAPMMFYTEAVRSFGSYDEQFFGYGYEDDYFMLLMKKNGIQPEYCTSATSVHQWHTRPLYEAYTGNANRCLFWRLELELLWEGRPAKANFDWRSATQNDDVKTMLAIISGSSNLDYPEFSEWVSQWHENPSRENGILEMVSFGHRIIAENKSLSSIRDGHIMVLFAKAAWGHLWERRVAAEIAKTSASPWRDRLFQCQNRYAEVQRTAISVARRIVEGEPLP